MRQQALSTLMLKFSTLAGWVGYKQSASFSRKTSYLPISKCAILRYAVWPYEGTPLQCTKCHKLDHVCASCIDGERCAKLAGSHVTSACSSEQTKCINCGKPHDAASLACAYFRREKEMYIANFALVSLLHILMLAVL